MPIRTETIDGIGVLTLDRPERAHAYDAAHLDALDAGFAALAADAHVIIIRSTGYGAFCGGADLDELSRATPEDAGQLRSQAVFTRIARSPAVSIAAVHGPAVAGGCELALACDLRVVGPRAEFRLPEPSLGIIPAAGGTTRLTRLLGPSVSKQVILAGSCIDAEDAMRLGLAASSAEDPFLGAMSLARRIRALDPEALAAAKQIIDATEEDRLHEAEREAQARLYARRGRTADES